MQARFSARLLALAAASGCAAQLAPVEPREPPPRRELDTEVALTAPAPEPTPTRDAAPCPDEMALIERGDVRVCIDRYEASIERRAVSIGTSMAPLVASSIRFARSCFSTSLAFGKR